MHTWFLSNSFTLFNSWSVSVSPSLSICPILCLDLGLDLDSYIAGTVIGHFHNRKLFTTWFLCLTLVYNTTHPTLLVISQLSWSVCLSVCICLSSPSLFDSAYLPAHLSHTSEGEKNTAIKMLQWNVQSWFSNTLICFTHHARSKTYGEQPTSWRRCSLTPTTRDPWGPLPPLRPSWRSSRSVCPSSLLSATRASSSVTGTWWVKR